MNVDNTVEESNPAGDVTEAPQNSTSPEEANPEVIERTSPNKRGLTSAAWTHFKREKVDDKWKAICKYCDKKLGGYTKQGTKHLHDHIRTCKLRTVRGPKQALLKTLTQQATGERNESLIVGNYRFDQDAGRAELGRMVEHIGFRRFCGAIQPLFKAISRNTLKSDIMKMYAVERAKTMKLMRFVYVPAPHSADVLVDVLLE
ncbi:Zinc finger, BED-type [Sesbania bispinosa]|nr:Zinc finger, BED-type [Sesbania bispinosa]